MAGWEWSVTNCEWLVMAVIGALTAFGTIYAATVAARGMRQSNETAERAREETREANSQHLLEDRERFAELLFSYVDRWLVNHEGPDQMDELRPQAALTGHGASAIEDWASDAIRRIGRSPVSEQEKGDARSGMKLELEGIVEAWLRDESNLPSGRFEHLGIPGADG